MIVRFSANHAWVINIDGEAVTMSGRVILGEDGKDVGQWYD